MVQRLGGVLTHMGDIWFYVYAIPDHRDPRNRRGLVVRGIPDRGLGEHAGAHCAAVAA
jgi:hypothetical protein